MIIPRPMSADLAMRVPGGRNPNARPDWDERRERRRMGLAEKRAQTLEKRKTKRWRKWRRREKEREAQKAEGEREREETRKG